MFDVSAVSERLLAAKTDIALAGSPLKNKILSDIADALEDQVDAILEVNEKEVGNAAANGVTKVMTDRLTLTKDRIFAMANSVRKVAALPDPIGEVIDGRTLPNGLKLKKVRVPIGVIGIIYEARPNVTVDAAVLCMKASNAVLLRGGKEAVHTSAILVRIMRDCIQKNGLSPDVVCFIDDTSHEIADKMMRLSGVLDVLIPRGGKGLIRSVVEHSTVPVIETGAGNCHVYVDKSADISMAVDIVNNAKTSRPSVCNACESLLVHKEIAEKFLPPLKKKLDEKNVVLAGCPRTCAILGNAVIPATDEDYAAEYLDYKISIKVVDSLEEAVSHIARYSTHHSETIVTSDVLAAQKFTEQVDSAAVYVNASTRFTDGEVFGLGAEIGISTQKLHARGPMGLHELTSSKYIVIGNGQIR